MKQLLGSFSLGFVPRKLLAAFFLMVASVAVAHAGPFGIEAGDPIAKFPSCQEFSPGHYLCKSVPKPHSLFGTYVLYAEPKTGVCSIQAASRDLDGQPVPSELDRITAQLVQKYGKKYRLEEDAAISRTIGWSETTGFAPTDGVTEIRLHGGPSQVAGERHFGVQLFFLLDTNDACQAEKSARDTSVL